jgi:hypothetical protein
MWSAPVLGRKASPRPAVHCSQQGSQRRHRDRERRIGNTCPVVVEALLLLVDQRRSQVGAETVLLEIAADAAASKLLLDP